MRIDIRVNPISGKVEGEILFFLKSGNHKQVFKRTWTVLGSSMSPDLLKDKAECLKSLLDIRLKELKVYLYKQLEQGVINTGTQLFPLERDWSIE